MEYKTAINQHWIFFTFASSESKNWLQIISNYENDLADNVLHETNSKLDA